MESGKWIRVLREEQGIKPSDVERISRSIAEKKTNPDFYVSHSTLADIEAGSIPSIHKLFSLAMCLHVPLRELFLPFGIDPEEIGSYDQEPDTSDLSLSPPHTPPFRFRLNFDTNFSSEETTILRFERNELQNLPPFFLGRFDPVRYRYAVIGIKDDGMADLLPPRSVVEVDTGQRSVEVFKWRSLRERPMYLVWHAEGHSCCWCQVDGRDLTLVPHPMSHMAVRRFKMPGQATIVGRVTNAWLPFESFQFSREVAS